MKKYFLILVIFLVYKTCFYCITRNDSLLKIYVSSNFSLLGISTYKPENNSVFYYNIGTQYSRYGVQFNYMGSKILNFFVNTKDLFRSKSWPHEEIYIGSILGFYNLSLNKIINMQIGIGMSFVNEIKRGRLLYVDSCQQINFFHKKYYPCTYYYEKINQKYLGTTLEVSIICFPENYFNIISAINLVAYSDNFKAFYMLGLRWRIFRFKL